MALNLVCAVLDRGPDDLSEMAVLLAIADSADKDTGEAWPSLDTIARRGRQSRRNVGYVVQRLVDGGWLSVTPQYRPNGSQRSSLYTVNLEKLGEVRVPRKPVGDARPPVQRLHPPQRKGCTPARATVAPHAHATGAPLEPSHNLEPSGFADFSILSDWQKKALREGKTVLLGATQYAAGTADLARLAQSFVAWERALQ